MIMTRSVFLQNFLVRIGIKAVRKRSGGSRSMSCWPFILIRGKKNEHSTKQS
jgi:hypothetical protein